MEHIEINYRRPKKTSDWTPSAINLENFNPRKGILTRYGKKLLKEGAKYYQRVNLGPFGDGAFVAHKPCPICEMEKSIKKDTLEK